MRKPRDFDAELKALTDRAKLLKDRKVVQLGELVVATCADGQPIDILAGALLAAVETKDAATKEGWRKRGAAFFQRTARRVAGAVGQRSGGGAARSGGAKPADAKDGSA